MVYTYHVYTPSCDESNGRAVVLAMQPSRRAKTSAGMTAIASHVCIPVREAHADHVTTEQQRHAGVAPTVPQWHAAVEHLCVAYGSGVQAQYST